MDRYLGHWKAFFLLFVVVLVYIPAAHYGLVWDDVLFLYDSPIYRHSDFWLEALRQPFILSPNYFRPVALLSFILELNIFGLNATSLHLANLLLHFVNTILIAVLARQFLRDSGEVKKTWLPLTASLVYGLHPALVEGVAFVSGRFDLLTTTFLLWALVVDALVQNPLRRSLAVAALFFLAMLCKESALVFIFIFPLWRLAFHSNSEPRVPTIWPRLKESGPFHTYLALLAAAGLYVLLRYLALGYLWQPGVPNVLETGDRLQHVLLISRSLTEYLSLIIWPFTNLAPIHYAALPVAKSSLLAWGSLIAIPLIVVALTKLIRSIPQSGWLVLAGLLSLLPVLNILPLQLAGGAIIAERYLLFPLGLFTLSLVAIAQQVLAARPEGEHKWLMPALWLAISIITIQLTLPRWQDDLALWNWGTTKAPLSPTPPTSLAMVYINQGSYQRALAEAERAIGLDSGNSDAWNNRGIALFYIEDYEKAQTALEEAVRLAPTNELAWSNLAATLREQGNIDEALQMLLEKALPLNPSSFAIHLNLAVTYLYADRPDLAVPQLQEALYLAPPGGEEAVSPHLAYLEQPEPWLRLGDRLLTDSAPEDAIGAFEHAETLGARRVDISVGISAGLIELGRFAEAESVLHQALEIAPNDPRLYNNLGMLSLKLNNLDAANEYFSRAIALAPEWDVPQQNLQRIQE